MKHPHAENMRLYAEDAMETDKPWERWEYESHMLGGWKPVACHPYWEQDIRYRRKPRTITINGHEVPEPMREAPEDGCSYWLPMITDSGFVSGRTTWNQDSSDDRWLARGLCHTTKEAAEAHARALLSFTAKDTSRTEQ